MCYDYHSGFALEILAINNPRIIIIIIITTISKVSSRRCSPSRISRREKTARGPLFHEDEPRSRDRSDSLDANEKL